MNRILVLAGQAPTGPAEGAEGEIGGVLKFVLANPFALAILFLFLVAVVGAFIAARKRDRCLKRFRKFRVTLQEQGGRQIWGTLKVFSKGLELVFEPPPGAAAHPGDKHSFLLYEAELGKVFAVYRFADRLAEKNVRRRARQRRKLADPPLASRAWRRVRNVVNTFRDAIVSAFGMTVQQASKASTSAVLKSQGGQINALGTMLVGETANAYEPMLEQYIGRPVVLELVNPADPEKRIVEYRGHLGEYSAQFILLADVERRFQDQVPRGAGPKRFLEGALEVEFDGGKVHVVNGAAVAVMIEGVTAGGRCLEVGREVVPGETAEVALPDGAAADGAVAAIAWTRRFEMIVPRACGIVRHASAAAEA
jgi:hypothetical protein